MLALKVSLRHSISKRFVLYIPILMMRMIQTSLFAVHVVKETNHVMPKKGGIQLPLLFPVHVGRPLSDFSFITVMSELLPMTYPRFFILISCPDYLAHITDM